MAPKKPKPQKTRSRSSEKPSRSTRASSTSRGSAKRGKAATNGSGRAITAKARGPKRGPRLESFPELGELRIRPLDDVCTTIAETREQINQLKAAEAGTEQTALNLLRKHNKQSWTHSGVTILRAPGEEKLVVRNARKRTATAEVEPEEATGPDPALDVDDEQVDLDEGDGVPF